MSESLSIISGTREEQYQNILPQITAMLSVESDLIANLANVSAALKEQFDWLWIGFYLLKNNELVLGPFQGPVACTRIQKGKGVCGTAWETGRTIIVDDVSQHSNHIVCSTLSKSEIVVPISKDGKVWGVLDIDSSNLNEFTSIDQDYLEQIAVLIQKSQD